MQLSIITPVYNTAPHHLLALSASIETSTAALEYEWLIIDDHSEQAATRRCLEQLAEQEQTRLLRNQRGKGAASARNLGAANAAAVLLTFVDADDLLLPGSLQFLVDEMTQRPQVRWLAADFAEIDDETTVAPENDPLAAADSEIEHWPNAAERLISETLFTQGSYIIDRQLFRQAGGFDERFLIGEDWYLWMRLAIRCELYYAHRVVMLQRRGHTSTMSGPLSLTDAVVRPYVAARADPQFAAVRKPLRWRIYHLYRLLSKRNQAAGRRRETIRFATLAALWAIDEPRQWLDAIRALVGLQLR